MNANENTNTVSFSHTVQERVKEAGAEKGKNVEIGKVSYIVPTLAAFGLNTPDGEPKVDSDGDLVYESKTHQWLWEAVQSAAKAQLISYLQPKSVEYKEGLAAWNTIAELVAGGSAVSQKGLVLKLRGEFRQAWATFIASLKKSPKVTQAFIALGSDFPAKGKDCALSVTSAGNKAAFARQLSAFFEQLNEGDQEKFGDIVTSFHEIASSADADLSDE